ncbi:MAG: LPS export ABC transporter permease LptF [Candidatus Binatota bacterium]
MKRTLTAYIISEVLPPFLLGLAAFTLMLLVARILRLVELVVTRGVPFLQIGKLFALILPTFLEMTVPMALLLGIFLGLGRLSGDHELLALKASGISPTQILLPIGTIALFISLITLLLTTLVRPAANLALKKELYNIAKNHVGTALREKVFNDDFPQVLIYVEDVVPPGDTSQGVLIVDRRNPARENIIFGKVALILSDEESKTINLKLFDGAIYEREKKRSSFSQTRFNTYDFKLDLEEAFSPIRKKERGPKEMSLRRLGKAIQLKEEQGLSPTAERIELHQRFSFAFAPLVLSLLGVSLVLVPTRSRASRSWGFTLCLSWLLVYYGLLSMGKALGERDILPPALALWIPNIVVGLIAIRLFRKALKESPLLIQSKLEDFSLYLNRRIAHYVHRDY